MYCFDSYATRNFHCDTSRNIEEDASMLGWVAVVNVTMKERKFVVKLSNTV